MRSPVAATGLALIAGLSVGLAAPARASEDEAERAARWSDLRHVVFGDRAVTDGSGRIVLEAPTRALDAATVPIDVTLPQGAGSGDDRVTAIYVLVDGNPSPVAGAFHFGPDGDPRILKMRVRVDQYTLIHAVAETQGGALFATESYVKAAGGCSAPSSKDAVVAMSRLGQMRFRLDGDAPLVPGLTTMASLQISHPNNNGMQVDQLSHNFIPARYIQSVTVRYGNDMVLTIDADISLSEDPVITFGLVPHGAGPLQVEMQDSTRANFHQSFPLADHG